MPTLVYSTGTDHARGWDYFDAMVLWAAAQEPHPTLGVVMKWLPVGICEHLVRKALDLAVADGLLLRVVDGAVRYQSTTAGRGRSADLASARAAA